MPIRTTHAKYLLALLAVLVFAVLALPAQQVAASTSGMSISKPPHANSRPNIVLIVSDDQTNWEMKWMPKTMRLIGGQGTKFTNAINPHPLCCPARAEILSGEFAQNNGVRYNRGPYGGYPRFASYQNGRNLHDNLAAWLQRSGYTTGFVGKMLNGYNPATSPMMDGWDYWSPLVKGTYDYYDFTLYNNGSPHRYTKGYVTNIVGRQSRHLISQWSGQSKPFFLWVSQVAPHIAAGRYVHERYHTKRWVPPIPAKRDEGLFKHVSLPTKSNPSFNETDISDKPSIVRRKQIDPREETRLFRQRIRSLQSLDRSNASIIRSLRKQGVLANTVVIFMTDNGYMLGEHRISGKNYPYDADLAIPMFWRGPGIPKGVVNGQTATTVDVAPTILDYARILDQVRGGRHTDGESLRGVFSGTTTLNTTSLIQGGTDDQAALDAFDGWWWRGVRTTRYTYVYWWTGEQELYDNRVDPYQLNNLLDLKTGKAKDPAYAGVLDEMKRRYADLRTCAGVEECERQDFGPDPVPTNG